MPQVTHSLSNTNEIAVTHISLDLTIKPEKNVFKGMATLFLEQKIAGFQGNVILDTRDLRIENVEVSEDGEHFILADFALSEPQGFLGQALIIESQGKALKKVRITYESGDTKQNAILRSQSSKSSETNFLFTLACPIRGRSIMPCQDTPSQKFTYDATIRTNSNLMAVMGTDHNPQVKNSEGVYQFTCLKPIPSYLFSLAVGDLAYQKISERTGVYAEPDKLLEMADELDCLEGMLTCAETLFGAYEWGRYDVLLLPPGFPYGAMENPCLTFMSQAIAMSGKDPGMLAKLVHEIAHAWFGNLVTPASWEDEWLSEGLVVFAEYMMVKRLFGQDIAKMEAYLRHRELLEAYRQSTPPNDQCLYRDLRVRDPEEIFDLTTYNKGFLFFYFLSEKMGEENFLNYLKCYVSDFKSSGITTEKFKAHIENYLRKHHVDFDIACLRLYAWFYEPGLPVDFNMSNEAFQKVERQEEQSTWVSQQWVLFLQGLQGRKISLCGVMDLDSKYQLSKKKNVRILKEWFMLVIENRCECYYEFLQNFLKAVGNIGLIKPLYAKLVSTDQAELARKYYQDAKASYHPLLCALVEKMLLPNKALLFKRVEEGGAPETLGALPSAMAQ